MSVFDGPQNERPIAKPKNGANLQEIVLTYKIPSQVLHHILGIRGTYVECGEYSSRSPKKIEEGASPDNDEWYILTALQPTSTGKENLKFATESKSRCIFKSSHIKKELGLEGYVKDFKKEDNNYLITTTSSKRF